jgi:hypothetical protein
MQYATRVFLGAADLYGDGRAGLVAHAIFAANTAHLDHAEEDRRIMGPGPLYPDEMLKPISIAQLAKSLGMPFETVRQTVNRLIDAGICQRVAGGVIIPLSSRERPEVVSAMSANLQLVRQFVRDLKAVGLDADP